MSDDKITIIAESFEILDNTLGLTIDKSIFILNLFSKAEIKFTKSR